MSPVIESGLKFKNLSSRLAVTCLVFIFLFFTPQLSFADSNQCEVLFDFQTSVSANQPASVSANPSTNFRDARESTEPNRSGRPALSYLRTISKWTDSWKSNLKNRLVNALIVESKNREPRDPLSPEFSIDDFQKAREYRSYFETQNRMMGELKDGPKISNALVKLFPDGRKALAAKLSAIREAKYTIDLTYYIFKSDDSGLAIMDELRMAIRRGISVRLMFDSAGTDKKTKLYLEALGEEARNNAGNTIDFDGRPTTYRATFEALEFHPIGVTSFVMYGRQFFRMLHNLYNRSLSLPEVDPLAFSINRRTHDKMLLIDGAFPAQAVVFTGGRNIGDENYDLSPKPGGNNVDMDVMMRSRTPNLEATGSGVEEIGTEFQKYFDTLYFHLGNRRLIRHLEADSYLASIASMSDTHKTVAAKLNLDDQDPSFKNELFREGFTEAQVQIVGTFHNLYRRGVTRKIELSDRKEVLKNGKALIAALESQLSKEEQAISIVSPYLWMSERQIRLLKAWLLEDPNRKLTIFTNSMISTDNMLAQILVDSVLGPELMLDRGLQNQDGTTLRRSVAQQVEIYEFGHRDSTALGGNVPYGNLHMKGILLSGSRTAIVGTYNGDPRSTLLNTEGMAIMQGDQVANQLEAKMNDLKAQSHLWGSEEYHELRANPKLSQSRQLLVRNMSFFYQSLLKLNLWWLL